MPIMESVVDIIPMEVLTNASKKQKHKWKYRHPPGNFEYYRVFWMELKTYLLVLLHKDGNVAQVPYSAQKSRKATKIGCQIEILQK